MDLFSLASFILIVVTCNRVPFSWPRNWLVHGRKNSSQYSAKSLKFSPPHQLVASVSCEKSFSALRRLKLWTRSRGLPEMLIHRGTNYMLPTSKERKSNWRLFFIGFITQYCEMFSVLVLGYTVCFKLTGPRK